MRCVVGGILVLAVTFFLAADARNFAGKWHPDLQRSTSEKTLKPAAGDPSVEAPPDPTPKQAGHPVERIEQSASTVKITLHDPDGEPTNTLEMSGGALQYVSRTRWEGESLVVECRMLRDGKPGRWGAAS